MFFFIVLHPQRFNAHFPATLTVGLAELGGDYLQQVQEDFHLYPLRPMMRDGVIYEDEEEKEEPPDLVLVECRVAELMSEEPEGFSKIATHLAGVEESSLRRAADRESVHGR